MSIIVFSSETFLSLDLPVVSLPGVEYLSKSRCPVSDSGACETYFERQNEVVVFYVTRAPSSSNLGLYF